SATLGSANAVGSFGAMITTNGSVSLTNTANPLAVTGISEAATGDVMITNTGGISINGAISAGGAGGPNRPGPGTSSTLTSTQGSFTATAGGSLSAAGLSLFDGSAVSHTWTINASSVTVAPGAAIPYAGVISLAVFGGTGSDTFNVSPSPNALISVIANDP